MTQFANHPDYRLRWPADLFRDALEPLLARGQREGGTREWRDDVELLLRQAFESPVPAEEFASEWEKPTPKVTYDYDEEPF